MGKEISEDYYDGSTKRDISRINESRNAESRMQVHSTDVQKQKTRTYNDEVSNLNKRRTYNSDTSIKNGTSNSNNVKYTIQEGKNNSLNIKDDVIKNTQ